MLTKKLIGDLEFAPITVNDEYAKKWNIHVNDFIVLTRNGVILRDVLYRVGGLGKSKPVDDYFMLKKYIESFYPDDVTKDPKRKPHLQGIWCILDKYGNEKYVHHERATNPYIVSGSRIYSVDRKYYDVETGYCFGQAYNRCESSEFLFIEVDEYKDKTKNGVYKINKKDGTWDVFK